MGSVATFGTMAGAIVGTIVGTMAGCGADDADGSESPATSASASASGTSGGPDTVGETQPESTASSSNGTETMPSSGPSTTDSSVTDATTDPTVGSTGEEPTTGGPDGRPWQPAPGTTWQWQLIDTVDTSVDVDVYDIDLFDVSQGVIDELHADGRVVICYFSAGSYEEWRPDAGDFPDNAVGSPLDGWPGEAWLDHRSAEIRTVMEGRLDLAVDKNCDAVEPDNVDGYTNDTGFDLNGGDQLDYNSWLAAEAHARGLSIGLKNDVDQVDALEPLFDWALNEECMSYQECETTSPFISAGKAVFHVEYVDSQGQGQGLADEVCPASASLGFSTLIKEWDLTPWRIACP